MEPEERADSVGDECSPRGAGARQMPLRVTRPILHSLAAELGLPTSASTEDLRQMVDGKLADMGRELRDVLVVIKRETTEAEGSGRVLLHDGEGGFLDTELLTTETPGSPAIAEDDAHAASSLAVETEDRTRDREAAERDRLAADVEQYQAVVARRA